MKKIIFYEIFKEIDYTNVYAASGISEVQKITLNSSFSAKYILSFENVETSNYS